MDLDGMNTDALEELLKQLERSGELSRVRMIYVCDYFQNPTGLTLSLPRRRHLLELAQRYSREPPHPHPGGRRLPRAALRRPRPAEHQEFSTPTTATSSSA